MWMCSTENCRPVGGRTPIVRCRNSAVWVPRHVALPSVRSTPARANAADAVGFGIGVGQGLPTLQLRLPRVPNATIHAARAG